ncbi:hydrogenase iron-sulfur subunit [Accumulibacter sp.]|nr:hydrogenase iron-sulfur subunit [Accumulibacter sp.]
MLACHPGDCHYKEGNLRAYCRAELLERLVPPGRRSAAFSL